MPDYKGPGHWRSQAVKAQGTAGSSPPKPSEKPGKSGPTPKSGTGKG